MTYCMSIIYLMEPFLLKGQISRNTISFSVKQNENVSMFKRKTELDFMLFIYDTKL